MARRRGHLLVAGAARTAAAVSWRVHGQPAYVLAAGLAVVAAAALAGARRTA
ncbi:hypothetical protein [Geodermatophilus dictyosporus]|uniref:hypothetical protein n=1 Tax=Geodermatophilus dictyosporus TaxID=1523247 RepID=UPI00145C32C5|nr:hypothetical protein [Geodermatophilus dictyosporus]